MKICFHEFRRNYTNFHFWIQVFIVKIELEINFSFPIALKIWFVIFKANSRYISLYPKFSTVKKGICLINYTQHFFSILECFISIFQRYLFKKFANISQKKIYTYISYLFSSIVIRVCVGNSIKCLKKWGLDLSLKCVLTEFVIPKLSLICICVSQIFKTSI